MIFPEHTYLRPARQIAKKRFLQELSLGSPARRSLEDDVHAIYWTASLKEASLHLPPGKEVMEIEVFTIALRQPRIEESLLTAIDRTIPYHILYFLTYEGKTQAWISYKETAQANEAFRVEKYYHTDWLEEDHLQLVLRGTSLDEVYENLVRAIAGARLHARDLREAVQEDERHREGNRCPHEEKEQGETAQPQDGAQRPHKKAAARPAGSISLARHP